MSGIDSHLEEIKSRVDIIDLISDYVALKKAGQNWKGLCPFHVEKTPSFTVSPAKQIYHCFGCGNGGDIFSFLIKYENISFLEALRMLAKRAGVILTPQKSRAATAETEKLLGIHAEARSFFIKSLKRYPDALAYLKNRGIDENGYSLFSLGYAPNSWNSLMIYLLKKGYTRETLQKTGLITSGRKGFYDTFRDRLIFPIHDLKGDIVAFGGRTMSGSDPKYLNSPETPIFNKGRILYGFHRARDSVKKKGYVILVEGYMDAITLTLNGFSHAVAPLGTAVTSDQGKLIKRFTGDVVIAFDSDRSGIKAAKAAAGILLESGLNVSVILMPGNDDPDGFLRKNGSEAFAALLEHPLSIIDFFTMQKMDKHLLARETLEVIAKIPDRILQGEYIRELSEKINVGEREVRDEFQNVRRRQSVKHGSKHAPRGSAQDRKPLEEIYMIKLLLQLPDKTEEVSRDISEDHFMDETARRVFRKIGEGARGLTALLSVCDNSEKELLSMTSLRADFDDPYKALEDCVKKLKFKRRSILLSDLQQRIKTAEANKDPHLLKRLQAEQCEVLKSDRQ